MTVYQNKSEKMLPTNFEFLGFQCDCHINLKIRKPKAVAL